MTQLTKKIVYKGFIEAMSGLMIGGTNSSMGIGGPDKTVIRNPLNNQPYIPGSTLKGKMRSLLDLKFGLIDQGKMGAVKFISRPTGPVANLFGNSTGGENQRPSRVIFRDCKLTNESAQKLNDAKTDLPYTEAKTEVVIDRITSAAMPRTNERVPAGAIFEFEAVINIFDDSDEDAFVNLFEQGIKLLEVDYIGGGGSRGSGHIRFIDLKKDIKTISEVKAN